MRKSLYAVPLVLAIATQTAAAQQPERDLYTVVEYTVPVGQTARFESAVARITEAAKKGEVKGGQDWVVWQAGPRYTAVFPLDNMAELDEVDRGKKAFAGTAGEADYTAGIAEMGQIPYAAKSEVVERLTDPGLVYRPANAAPRENIRVAHFYVQPGKGKDFEALAKDVIGIYGEVGYPYDVDVYRTVVGEGRRYTVVTFHDGLADFHGANSLATLLAAKNMREKWEAEIVPRYTQIVAHEERMDAVRQDHMTYFPGS